MEIVYGWFCHKRLVPAVILAATIFVGMLIAPPVTLAAQKVSVRAGDHGEWGRIVFDWGAAKKFDATIEGGFLVVRFKEALSANLGPVKRELGDFILSAQIMDNGTEVRFKLKGNYKLKSAVFGNAIALDLYRDGGVSSIGKAEIRAGEHAKFSRIVFDWPQKVPYEIRQDNNAITVIFEKPARIDNNEVNRYPPRHVKRVDISAADGKTVATVTTDGARQVKHFRNGNSVIVDILAAKAVDVAQTSPTKPEPAKAPAPARVEKKQEPAPKTVVASAREPAAAKVAPKPPLTMPAEPEAKPAEKLPVAAAPAAEPEKTPASKPRSLMPKKPNELRVSGSEKGVDDEAVKKLTIQVGKLKDGFRLIFPWDKPSGLTLFERAGFYWAIFDQKANVDFSELSGPYKFLVKKSVQYAHDSATVLRFELREGYKPKVDKLDNEWRVDFRLTPVAAVDHLLDIRPQAVSAKGPYIFLPATLTGEVAEIVDPDAGDVFLAVPLYEKSWGVGVRRIFSQLVLLPTAQGVAILPKDNRVAVNRIRNGIEITAEGGLQLSRDLSRGSLFAAGDGSEQKSEGTGERLINIETWKQVPKAQYIERKQELQLKVARVPNSGRNAARMELTKFFAAHEFFAEAKGTLERILLDNPNADEQASFKLVRGVISLGLHRPDEAEADFYDHAFDNVPSVAPWRAMTSAAKKDWAKASTEFAFGRGMTDFYAKELQERIQLTHIESALADFDVALAKELVNAFDEPELKEDSRRTVARFNYLKGLLLQRSGEVSKSIPLFEKAISLGYRPIEAKADYEKVNAELAANAITPEEAIERLERLKYFWRGDDLELTMLKRLGDLYIAIGNPGKGLEIFRRIISMAPRTVRARDIAREMADIFKQLFNEGGVDNMPPIKALALYYGYRELTPVGKDGDKMISKLADRLASIDLLEQAAQLLDHQVNFRLEGLTKALTGTRLAVLYILDRKPKEALKILRKSRWRKITRAHKTERRHISAQANIQLSRYDKAIEILKGDNSEQADLMRADIYWKSKDWSKSAVAVNKILGERWKSEKPLNAREQKWVMRMALSYNLGNDVAGIKRLRRQYVRQMTDTPYWDAFDLTLEQDLQKGTNFRKMASVIAKVSQLESVMAGYREKVKSGALFATN